MYNFLDFSAFAFDVIGSSETWFTAQTDANSFQIPRYTYIHTLLLPPQRGFSIPGALLEGIAFMTSATCLQST